MKTWYRITGCALVLGLSACVLESPSPLDSIEVVTRCRRFCASLHSCFGADPCATDEFPRPLACSASAVDLFWGATREDCESSCVSTVEVYDQNESQLLRCGIEGIDTEASLRLCYRFADCLAEADAYSNDVHAVPGPQAPDEPEICFETNTGVEDCRPPICHESPSGQRVCVGPSARRWMEEWCESGLEPTLEFGVIQSHEAVFETPVRCFDALQGDTVRGLVPSRLYNRPFDVLLRIHWGPNRCWSTQVAVAGLTAHVDVEVAVPLPPSDVVLTSTRSCEVCDDGIDNDGDGETDWMDAECR